VFNKIKQRRSKDILHFIKHLDVIIHPRISVKVFRCGQIRPNKINVRNPAKNIALKNHANFLHDFQEHLNLQQLSLTDDRQQTTKDH
jgi:hypothetical protein